MPAMNPPPLRPLRTQLPATLALMLPKTAKKSRVTALVQIEDESFDLSGEPGRVRDGR